MWLSMKNWRPSEGDAVSNNISLQSPIIWDQILSTKVLHTYNFEIYAGKQPGGQYPHSNKPTDVIKRLVEPINSTGCNIMAVNWFMDVNWVFELRKRNLSYVDTLKKNKPHLPVELVAVKNRPEKSSLFGFRKAATVVSYIPRKRKMSSWLHHYILMMPLIVKQAVNWSQKL